MGNEISIDTSMVREAARHNWILRAVAAFCVTLSVVMGLVSGFNIDIKPVVVIPGIIAGSVLSQFLLRKRRSAVIGYIVIICAMAVVCLICMDLVTNGFSKVANDVLTTVNKNMAMANLLFVVDGSRAVRDEAVAMAVMSFGLAAAMSLFISIRLNLLVSVIVFLAVTISMLYKGDGHPVWLVLGLVSVVLTMYVGNVRGRITPGMYVNLGIGMIVIAGVMAAVYVMWTYSPLSVIDDLKTGMQYHGENVVYGKSDYPEGKFARYDDLAITGEERMRIRMDKPKQLYLRGFVGSKYTEDGWTDSDLNIYGGTYEGVFEWFSGKEYSPLVNLAAYVEQSELNGGEAVDETIRVTVTNETARRKYQYVPECVTYDSLNGLYAAKNDVNFRSQGLGRQVEYSYDIVDVVNNDYKNIYWERWYQDQSGDKSFHDCENVYGTFARTYYEDIPDELRAYLDSHAPESGKTLNPFDAIKVVRDYTASNMSYSNEADPYSGDGDFVTEMLDEHKAGYSAHFATVAAMLFRYYGIPARYVEGYLVNPDASGKDVSVTDEDSHAWVEIYAAGVGFIPVEVTPGYYSDDEDTGSGSTGGGSTPQTIPPQEDEQQDDNSDGGSSAMQYLMYVIVVIIILIVLFILVMTVRRIVIAIIRREGMRSSDSEKSIAVSGEYMERLAGYGGRTLADYVSDDVLDLMRRYKFSRYVPDSRDAEIVRNAAASMKKSVVKEQNAVGRFKMGFWNALR